MKFSFMEIHRSEFPIAKMATAFGVSRSGFYAAVSRSESSRSQANRQLLQLIKEIQQVCKYRYGSPRITEELRARGQTVGENRVAHLIAEHELGAKRKKPYKVTTISDHDEPVAENLLARQFSVEAPNRVWVTDFTYVPTAEGWLYLVVVLDLYSRKVVGWSIGIRATAELVIRAIVMAIITRHPPQGLILHSDRGVQYACRATRRLIKDHKFVPSMSRKGNPWDNAVAESFFATLEQELLFQGAFRSRDQARVELFDFIEIYYNRKRLHSTLGYMSPEIFEQEAQKAIA